MSAIAAREKTTHPVLEASWVEHSSNGECGQWLNEVRGDDEGLGCLSSVGDAMSSLLVQSCESVSCAAHNVLDAIQQCASVAGQLQGAGVLANHFAIASQ
eukprot:3851-Heterococcus_DN1.PRE.1